MSAAFVLLFLLAVTGLIWGLFAPHHIAKVTHIKREVTRKHTSSVFIPLAITLFVLAGATAPQQPKTVTIQQASVTKPVQPSNADSPAKRQTPTVTTKQETETQAILFTTEDQNTSSLAKGKTRVTQQGQDGIETLTYKVTYTNGTQTDKTLVSTIVTTQPVVQIIEVGTYVAPATPAPSLTPMPTAAPTGCHPLTSGGNCYRAGEYCSNADHGMSGTAGNGESIICEDNDGWRWEPA